MCRLKSHHYVYKKKKYLHEKYKASKKTDIEQNVWEKITENLGFVENSNFTSESTEAAVRGCSSIYSEENTRAGALIAKL